MPVLTIGASAEDHAGTASELATKAEGKLAAARSARDCRDAVDLTVSGVAFAARANQEAKRANAEKHDGNEFQGLLEVALSQYVTVSRECVNTGVRASFETRGRGKLEIDGARRSRKPRKRRR